MITVLLAALSAQALLERSIAHHDPYGVWEEGAFEIVLSEERPNGIDRETTVAIDNERGSVDIERRYADGTAIEIRARGDEVTAVLNGDPDISSEDAERYRLGRTQALRTRNYYLYLYGLPMKLRDPGTRLDPEAKRTTFQDRPAYELRVTYDEDVGRDTWYFYLDPDDFALIGYRFYHDESKNDGEYIVLSEEATGAGLALPRIRTWYRHQDDLKLGTDTILSLTSLREN